MLARTSLAVPLVALLAGAADRSALKPGDYVFFTAGVPG